GCDAHAFVFSSESEKTPRNFTAIISEIFCPHSHFRHADFFRIIILGSKFHHFCSQSFVIENGRVANINVNIHFSSHTFSHTFGNFFNQFVCLKPPFFIHIPESSHHFYFTGNDIGSVSSVDSTDRKY